MCFLCVCYFFLLQNDHFHLTVALFQTFVKGYLITFVRLLLGIDAEEGSGHLSSVSLACLMLDRFSLQYNCMLPKFYNFVFACMMVAFSLL